MRGSSAATSTDAWPDTATSDDALAPVASESGAGLHVVETAKPLVRVPDSAPRADVVDALRASLAQVLHETRGTLSRLRPLEPLAETAPIEVRVLSGPGAFRAVLLAIGAGRGLLTIRTTDGALTSWLVDGAEVVARLPPGAATRLGDGVTVTFAGNGRALVAVRERRWRGGSTSSLSLDLSTLDVEDVPPRVGPARSRRTARPRRFRLDAAPPFADGGRRATGRAVSRERSGVATAIPPGMARRDAVRIEIERRRLERVHAAGGDTGGIGARALADAPAFLAGASERFLSGARGANAVLDASPVLYGVLGRYHGVCHTASA